jgi:hypothetical protein
LRNSRLLLGCHICRWRHVAQREQRRRCGAWHGPPSGGSRGQPATPLYESKVLLPASQVVSPTRKPIMGHMQLGRRDHALHRHRDSSVHLHERFAICWPGDQVTSLNRSLSPPGFGFFRPSPYHKRHHHNRSEKRQPTHPSHTQAIAAEAARSTR